MSKAINDTIYCEKAASKFFRSKVWGKYEQYEDLMQEYRIKLWKNRDKILEQPNVSVCKQTIMSSVWKDYLRAISKDKVTKELLECNFTPSTDEVSGDSYYDFLESIVVEAPKAEKDCLSDELLALLPADQAEIIKLRYDEDITFEEIAERLKIPKPTAYFRHQRGIKALQKKYTLQEILDLV